MPLKTIGILVAAITVVFAGNFELQEFFDNSGKYNENIEGLLNGKVKEKKHEEKKGHNVCQTDACKILGREFKSSMNTSVDPCENFYDFVCGAWKDKVDLIPPYADSWGTTEIFQHTVYKRIKAVLEVDPKPSDILPVRQAKKWYRTCMDQDAREKRGIKPIESILMQTGGWPMVMEPAEWFQDDFSWQELEKNYFYITGEFTFYEIEPDWGDSEDGTESIITITNADLPLYDKFPRRLRRSSKKKEWDIYKSFMTKVVKEFIKHNMANVTDEMIEKDVNALATFEEKMKKVIRKAGYYVTQPTFGDFLSEYNAKVANIPEQNKIQFRQLFKILFGMVNIDIEDDQDIVVISANSYPGLSKLFNETPKRTIVNYIHWKFVSDAIFLTTERMETIFTEEVAEHTGIEEKRPRWLQCVEDLQMEHAASYAFATKYFTKHTEKAVLKIIESIRQELTLEIENTNWLNRKGKDVLIDKLNAMKIFIGFPDWYKNETAVKASYKGLKVGYDYFENVLNFNKYKIRQMLQYMKAKKEEGPWDEQPIVVNAFYAPDVNSITVPAADLQPPLFTPDLPDNINYGTVGCVIGHEMGHGYDDDGIKPNKEGNKTELSNQMIDNYYKQAECFLDQFNNYWGVTEPVYEDTTPKYGEGSIGRRTRGENIADTTGLHSVFRAWQKVKLKRGKEDDKLPGLEEFTDEQMFFIGFATTWCSVERPEYVGELKEDEHSLPHLRVIGAVSNSKEFARVFNCPKGSPMNPDDKCSIWKADEETNEIAPLRRRHRRKRRHSSRWALNGW